MELADLLSDRFEIEQQIGSGGMGAVFRARDRASGALVAIKVIAGGHELRSARFAREVELLAELSHPGIVRYIAHGETRVGELYLVMEWLDGEDLAARLAREPLTMGESVKLATRVAAALAAAHARGIVHRDLKPSNLLLPGGQIEQVKVLDFGVALRVGRAQLTQTGSLVGTPGYMAPEQARNQGMNQGENQGENQGGNQGVNQGMIDARADVFALGCVLFECLTGTRPFEGDSPAATLGKILFGEAPRVSALRADVPEDLDALVAKMMAKDPALRPSDGANLAAALAMLGPLAYSEATPPRGAAAKHAMMIGGEPQFLAVVLLGPAAAGEPVLAEAALHREVEPYGGHLELLADGSIMVLLTGDRQMASDHAARAARCALALRALAVGRPISIAMGRVEASGRLLGGEVIDRASGLLSQVEQGAPGGPPQIALDDMIAGLLDARFDVVERESGLLLRGERALMQGARTLLGRPTSCVGRDWELGALAAILDDCIEEQKAHVVVVTAMAGIGKSRLGAELVSRILQRGDEVAIWIGRGDSLRAGSTLDLLAQALRGALGIGGGEPLPERRARIRARVAQNVPAADQQRVAEFLGELVGTPFSDGEAGSAQLKATRQDAQLMSEQMRNAWLDFLGAETSARPVLLVLEDLHWSDFGTVSFIDTALRDRADRPWMVLALARPEVFDVFPKLWAERQNVQEIRLKELGKKASERLVRQVLGDTVDPDTMERLVEQADGNAFYLEELIRAAAEGKDLALPETVLAMIETRLGRSPIEARHVLRAASVFGEVCWEGGVAALLRQSMGPSEVTEWLARLVDQEMLTARSQSRFAGERELAFRHALLREGAYATLSEEDRQLGHRRAGEWLAQHGEDDPMILAGHLERGGARAQAASYYLRAAQQAFHVLDLDTAMTRAALGLGCAPPQELRFALLGIRCEVAVQGVHLLGEAMPGAEELLRLAPRGSTPWAQGFSLYLSGTLAAGRIEDLLAAVALLREVDPAPDALAQMSLAYLGAIYVQDLFGRVFQASSLETRFFTAIRPHRRGDLISRFWWNVLLGLRCSYAHEDPWTGLVHGAGIQEIFDAIGGERNFKNVRLYRGMNLFYLGAFEVAERVLREIEGADVTLGVAGSLRRFHLAWLLADRGAFDDARVLATGLIEDGRAHHLPLEESRGRWALAEVLRRAGDHAAAARELEAALAMVVPLERPGVLGTLSALHLARGRAADALAAAEEALARYRDMGGCGLFRGAFVRLAHAEALHATGAHGAARRAIAAARAHLFEIAGRVPDPALRRSFLEDVPENARTLALARAWVDDA